MLRVAVTQTRNAFSSMPEAIEDLPLLEPELDHIRDANLDHHVDLVRIAAEHGAQIIGFGELFTSPYFALTELPMWRGLAEDAITGPSVTRLRETAREHEMIIIAPIYEKDAKTGHLFNTAVVIEEHGEILGTYRKLHIPQGSNDKGTFFERFYYGASDGKMFVEHRANCSKRRFFPVFQTGFARIGVAICYDRHFEGVMSSLAEGGAQIVFSPAVTFGSKSQRLWRMEFATDAARHNLFIAGSNREGAEKPWNVPFYGDGHVVGPNGALEDVSDHPQLVISDIDLDELEASDPAGWRLQGDRRHDIFD
jgi:N-carbamoylputrescine amidase